ncbi:MAG TPA: anti-sigma regulatory factor [Candidatus Micrarchaeaceae archaeon]|nr:anti-sigma regulatory factor [Candidatus Micrarchaeaceae archaeon]
MPAEAGRAALPEPALVRVNSEADVIVARQRGREMAAEIGFNVTDQALIATAISELARNILQYARTGEVSVQPTSKKGRAGLVIVASDQGPGIANVTEAMQDGYSTNGGLGLGLPGSRRLVDEFEVETELGRGTVITARKFLPAEG